MTNKHQGWQHHAIANCWEYTANHLHRETLAKRIFATGFHPNEVPAKIDECWGNWPEDQQKARKQVDALLHGITVQVAPPEQEGGL